MIFITTAIAIAALAVVTARWFFSDRVGIDIAGMILFVVMLVVYQLPIQGLPLIGYIGAAVGDVSALSMLLILYLASKPYLPRPNEAGSRIGNIRVLLIPLATAAVLFYPATLGLGMLDPYSWGFQPLIFIIVIAIYGAWLVQRNHSVAATMLAICLIAYLARLQESDNLWDYLLDPILAVSCWVWSIGWLIAKIKHRRARQTQ